MPEILLRVAPHPTLERCGVARDDRIDVAVAIAGVLHENRLEREPVLAIRLPDSHAEHHRDLESQGEDRRAARRLGGSAEKWNERRGQPEHTLVGEESNGPVVAERTRGPANRVGVVNDYHPDLRPSLREVAIEERIAHPASDGIEWNAAGSQVRAAELPVTEVSSDEDESPAEAQYLLDRAPIVDALEQVEHSVGPKARQQGRLDGRSAEVLVRATRDPVDVRFVEARERSRDLSLDNAPPNAERPVA